MLSNALLMVIYIILIYSPCNKLHSYLTCGWPQHTYIASSGSAYSSYKSVNTFKALVAISPAGHVNFVSSHTGCISDVQLVERSGFLGLLQKGDKVMVDRGFTIGD